MFCVPRSIGLLPDSDDSENVFGFQNSNINWKEEKKKDLKERNKKDFLVPLN